MKIRAITNYSWWTVGKTYEIQAIEKDNNETWYTIIDDKCQKAELSDIRNKNDFEIVDKYKNL